MPLINIVIALIVAGRRIVVNQRLHSDGGQREYHAEHRAGSFGGNLGSASGRTVGPRNQLPVCELIVSK